MAAMESTASIVTAVKSVVAITTPIAALSQTLQIYLSKQPNYGCGSIRDLLDEINVLTSSLNQLADILDNEIEDVEDAKPRLLSDKAVEFIKERADQSLVLFWRIEQQLKKRRDPRAYEENLVKKLMGFNEEIKENKKGGLERLDGMGLLIRLESRKWVDVAPKIDRFSKQLRKLQLNLALVFQVVSIRARSKDTQWPMKSEEVRTLDKIYSKAIATAARVDLGSISEKLETAKHTRGGRYAARGRLYDDRSRSRRRYYSSSRSRSRSSSRSLSPIPPPPGNRPHSQNGGGEEGKMRRPVLNQPSNFQSTSNCEVKPREKAGENVLDEKCSGPKNDESKPATSDLPAYEKCQSEKPQLKSASDLTPMISDVVKSPKIPSFDGQTVKFGSPSILGRIKSIFRSSRPTEASKPPGDDQSHLLAYVIKNETRFQIPISGDIKITEPEKREIDWWKTFAFLSDRELLLLEKAMMPDVGVDVQKGTWSKSVVHLERLEESSMKFWTPNNSALLVVIHAKLQKDENNKFESFCHFCSPAIVDSSAPAVVTPRSYGPPPPPPPAAGGFQEGPPPPPPPPGAKSPFGLRSSTGPPPPPPGFKRPISSTKIFDLGPRPVMDLKACLEILTSFSMFTMHMVDYSTYGVYNTTAEPSWERVAVVEQKIAPEQIKKQIQKLNKGWLSKSVMEKKLDLERAPQEQISRLLDELQQRDFDPNFSWELEQLDTKYKRRKLVTIVVYVKRIPMDGLNPIDLHKNISMNRAARLAGQSASSAPLVNQSCRPQPPLLGGGGGAAGPFAAARAEPEIFNHRPASPKFKPVGMGRPRATRSYSSLSSVTTYTSESSFYSSSDSDSVALVERRGNRNQKHRGGSDEDELDVIQELLNLWTVAPTSETSDDCSKGKTADAKGSTERALTRSSSYVDLVTALGKTEESPTKEAGEQNSAKDVGMADQKEAPQNDETTGENEKNMAKTQLSWLGQEYATKVVGATKPPAKRRYRSPARRSRNPPRRYRDESDSGW